MSGDDLRNSLHGFIGGSGEWHTYSPLFSWALLTDGAKYLAENAGGGAYWLMDLICSHQPEIRKRHPERYFFQVWTLDVKPDQSCVATCNDGDGFVMVRQEIEWSDFPLETIKLYASWEDNYLVIYLPVER